MQLEIKMRISFTMMPFGKSGNVLRNKEVTNCLKRNSQYVLPVLTYGVEIWSFTKVELYS